MPGKKQRKTHARTEHLRCEECNRPFRASRTDAKYDSAKCRTKAYRRNRRLRQARTARESERDLLAPGWNRINLSPWSPDECQRRAARSISFAGQTTTLYPVLDSSGGHVQTTEGFDVWKAKDGIMFIIEPRWKSLLKL